MAERPAIKICGVQRREDALLADELGADYLGVVLSAGFGRSVDPARGAELTEGVGAVPVAVLVDEPPDAATRLGRAIGAGVLQLHGSESPDLVAGLRGAGDWRLWKAIRAGSADDVRRAVAHYGELVDGFLVEGHLNGVVGGGGARLGLSPSVVGRLLPEGRLFVMAGGLTPDTVADAVARYAPDVVDVSSGVETGPGGKDPDRLRSFFEAVRAHRGSTR